MAEAIERLRSLAVAALERSPTVRDIAAGVRASQQDVREVEALGKPQVNLSVSSRFTEPPSNSAATPLRGVPYYVVSATQLLWDFGRLESQVQSRRTVVTSQQERLRLAYEAIAGETLSAAAELSRYRAQLAATDLYHSRMEQLLRMIAELVREDRGRSAELLQVQSRLMQAKTARALIEVKVRENEIILARLVGDDAAARALIDAVCDPATVAALLVLPSIDGFLVGLPNHPALRQLEAEAAGQTQVAQAAANSRLPVISAVAGRTPTTPGVTTQYLHYAGVDLTVPLYRGGADRAQERSALDRSDAARERREQTERELTSRVRVLHQTALSQLERVDEYLALLKISDRVRQDIYDQWSLLGRRSLYELLGAEAEHHSLRMGRLSAIHDSWAAQLRLRTESAALGDWFGVPSKESSR
jgi:adhesin transport system outer membrane protein